MAIFRLKESYPHILQNQHVQSLLLFFTLISSSFAQQLNFRHVSVLNGLPDNRISAFCEGSDGSMWVGTLDQGVLLYDGQQFKSFDTRNGLPGNTIRDLELDGSGRLVVATDHGVGVFDGKKWKAFGLAHGLPFHRVNRLYRLKDGRVLIGTAKGVAVLVQDSIVVPNGIPPDFARGDIRDFELDLQDRLWVACSGGGVMVFNLSGENFNLSHHFSEKELGTNNARALTVDQTGVIWIGTGEQGILRYDGTFRPFSNTTRFKSNCIRQLVTDASNRIWGPTEEGGTFLISGDEIRLLTQKNGVPGDIQQTVYADSYGKVWVGSNANGFSIFLGDHLIFFDEIDDRPIDNIRGTRLLRNGHVAVLHGRGLSILNKEKQQIAFQASGPAENRFLSVAEHSDGTVYIGTASGKLLQFGSGGLIPVPGFQPVEGKIAGMYADPQSNALWIRTVPSGLLRFDLQTRKMGNVKATNEYGEPLHINDVLVDGERGLLWAGTRKGLFKVRNNMAVKDSHFPEDVNITCIRAGKNGYLYMGSRRYGLIAYHPDKKEVSSFSRKEGLPSNSVADLLVLKDHTFVVSPNHMVKVPQRHLEKGKVRPKYIHGDKNVRKKQFINNSGSIVDQSLWLGTPDGLLVYDLRLDKDRVTKNKRPLHIQEVFYSSDTGIVYKATGTCFNDSMFVVPAHMPLITIRYAAIEFTGNPFCKYRSQLIGFESGWSESSHAGQASYVHLSAGHYTFAVQFFDQVSKEILGEARVHFTVEAPIYQTTLFYFLLALAVLSLITTIWLIFRRIMRKEIPVNNLGVKRTLLTNRILLMLGGVMYPCGGYVYVALVEGAVDTPVLRLLFAVYFLIPALLSFRYTWMKKRLAIVIEAGYYFIIVHLFYLLYLNDLRPEYVLGLFLALHTVSLIILNISRIIIFFVILVLVAFLVYWYAPEIGFNRNFFFSSIIASGLLSFLVVAIKVQLTHRLTFAANLMNRSGRLTMVFKDDGKAIYVTRNSSDILGVHKSSLLGFGWQQYFLPVQATDKDHTFSLKESFTNPLLKHYVNIFQPESGEQKIIQWVNYRTEKDLVFAEGIDVTRISRENEEHKRFHSVLTNIKRGILILDKQGRITWANAYFSEMTGFSPEEVMGYRPGDYLSGEETDRNQVRKARLLSNEKKPFDMEVVSYTKQGEKNWVSVSSTPLFNADGEAEEFVEIITDISLHKQALEDLKKEQIRFRDMLELSTDMVLTLEINGKIIYANKTFLRFIGSKQDELYHKDLREFVYPPEIAALKKQLEKISKTKEIRFKIETTLLARRGTGLRYAGWAKCYTENGKKWIACILHALKEESAR